MFLGLFYGRSDSGGVEKARKRQGTSDPNPQLYFCKPRWEKKSNESIQQKESLLSIQKV